MNDFRKDMAVFPVMVAWLFSQYIGQKWSSVNLQINRMILIYAVQILFLVLNQLIINTEYEHSSNKWRQNWMLDQ